MSLESAIIHFDHHPKRGFRYERYYNDEGKKMWQASCQFEVRIELEQAKLNALERASIEYRQYIRGGVWVRRGSERWTDDDKPNGNEHFRIPPYAGQNKVTGLPMGAVPGVGLSLSWKEDGEVENGKVERYGYRDTATVHATNEVDSWRPAHSLGHSYLLRDTPSIRGEWGVGETVRVWIELWFKGFVVEVARDAAESTQPIRILKEKNWRCFWQDEEPMTEWLKAEPI